MELDLQAFAYGGDKVNVILSNGQSYIGIIEQEDSGYAVYESNESKVNEESPLAQFTASDVISIKRTKESQIIFKLVQLSDSLDKKGLIIEANKLDSIIQHAMDFTSITPMLTPDRPLDNREIERVTRLSIAAEHDAIHTYELIADSVQDEKIKKLFQDIANEEKVHIGEFEQILEILNKDNDEFVNEGEDEAEEKLSD